MPLLLTVIIAVVVVVVVVQALAMNLNQLIALRTVICSEYIDNNYNTDILIVLLILLLSIIGTITNEHNNS